MAEKENFYHELDTKTKRSYCTCQTLALAFVLLAVAIAIGVAMTVHKVTTAVLPARQVASNSDDLKTLQQKVVDLNVAPGASTSLTITERELTSLLVTGISKDPNIPLRNIQAQINPDGIIINGTATEYLKTSVAITVIPKAVDNHVSLELVKIEAGSFAVPSFLTQKIAQGLDNMLSNQLNQLQDITIRSILLNPGSMTITGTIKNPTPSPS